MYLTIESITIQPERTLCLAPQITHQAKNFIKPVQHKRWQYRHSARAILHGQGIRTRKRKKITRAKPDEITRQR